MLTSKEKSLLMDQKGFEELCIKKYSNYAEQAQDPELKQLFKNHEQAERTHLQTVTDMLSGKQVQVGQGQQGGQSQQMGQNQQMGQGMQQGQMNQKTGLTNQADIDLCKDLLSTEKFVSSTYDTCIFEFVDHNNRMALNHIQKEEQEHGEQLFNYLKKHGAYPLQA